MTAATITRQERAKALAATAHSWPRVTVRGVSQAWAVPSQSESGKYHLTSRVNCDCRGWQHGKVCVHVAAVRILAAKQTPGYAQAVRHFTAPFNASESVAAVEARERQQRQAARYDAIWSEAA